VGRQLAQHHQEQVNPGLAGSDRPRFLWCDRCRRNVQPVRSSDRSKKWVHGLLVVLTVGLWAVVWLRLLKRQNSAKASPQWECPRCGSGVLNNQSSLPPLMVAVAQMTRRLNPQNKPDQQGPNRFSVVGTDRESGFQTKLVIAADDEAEARIQAKLKGVDVAGGHCAG